MDGVDSPCLSGQANRRGAGDPGRPAVSVDACAQVCAHVMRFQLSWLSPLASQKEQEINIQVHLSSEWSFAAKKNVTQTLQDLEVKPPGESLRGNAEPSSRRADRRGAKLTRIFFFLRQKPCGHHSNIEISKVCLFVFPYFRRHFCMRYLKFRNILILLEVQEIDRLSKKKKKHKARASPSETRGKWNPADTSMVVRRERPASKVAPEYAPISKKQTNEKETNGKQPRKPRNAPSPQPHTTQRELELQCSKESSGEGRRSDEFIETKGNQASEPNT